MRHGVQRFMVCVALALSAGLAAAQDRNELLRQRPGSGLKADSVIVAEIGEKLASTDPAQRKAGMDALRTRIQQRGMGELRTTWFKTLVNHKLYQELVDIARDGILAHPHETRNIEAVLQARIKALIVLGRSKEALSEARSLFNVAGMTGTADAILAFAEVLSVVHPNDADVYNRFRDEQVAGVGPSTTGAAATQPTKAVICTVLTSVPIDPAPFDQALAKITGEDAQALLGRGNLLLMSGRPAEARVVFEKMYSLAGADLVEASESLARCIKAEDGTIGRANAYILSLRPKR